ncbi:MAG: CoB--CoM heterodisulfide reductase iron-sulfur subunit A family protein [Candidatus Bathyarchaeota archaeon]|nr:MAG: CoB--CoM heterodisulfide reductase iron-sulfur subunit A family protein [Candidatus Bathyarchaeota archaeon]
MEHRRIETPKIGVFICHCGINIGGVIKVPEVVQYAKKLPNVVYAEENLYTCSSEGLSKIKEGIQEHHLDRVIVASCTPRTHESLFRATCTEVGLNKYLFEMANIRDQCSWVHMKDPEAATEKAKDLVRMAVAKASLLHPQEETEIDVIPSALVVGGGIAGITTALCLANQGFSVYIVEKEAKMGGMLRYLHKLYPTMRNASEVLNQLVNEAKASKNIEILTSSVVKEVKGFIGNFEVAIQKGDEKTVNFEVGTIIVATGATDFEPVGMYGYKKFDNVITQLQLEQLLKKGRLQNLKRVVMIQCVGSRQEGRSYCSRICCMTALKNSKLIRESYPDANIHIFYRDLQTYGQEYEKYYREVQEKGVKFIKYLPEKPPEVSLGENGKLNVNVYHSLINKQIEISADLVVLSTPLIQHEDAKELSQKLKVPLGPSGFFLEAHVKLRPVDFATDGVFVCGSAHWPADVGESISQAYGAASRASIPMSLKRLHTEALNALVDEEICSGCGLCELTCPFAAIRIEETKKGRKAKVIAASCKGCGACGAGCPQMAISMQHFTDEQLLAQIAALAEVKS